MAQVEASTPGVWRSRAGEQGRGQRWAPQLKAYLLPPDLVDGPGRASGGEGCKRTTSRGPAPGPLPGRGSCWGGEAPLAVVSPWPPQQCGTRSTRPNRGPVRYVLTQDIRLSQSDRVYRISELFGQNSERRCSGGGGKLVARSMAVLVQVPRCLRRRRSHVPAERHSSYRRGR